MTEKAPAQEVAILEVEWIRFDKEGEGRIDGTMTANVTRGVKIDVTTTREMRVG